MAGEHDGDCWYKMCMIYPGSYDDSFISGIVIIFVSSYKGYIILSLLRSVYSIGEVCSIFPSRRSLSHK